MSIFGKILAKIFPSSEATAAPAPAGTAPGTATAPSGTPATPTPTATPTGAPTATPAATAPAAARAPVDVGALLTFMAANKDQKLNWQTSIVDLLKLLDLDSSFAARKELAQELGYKGDTGDSAAMNIWLHKQVMNKLAENGGQVPDELRR